MISGNPVTSDLNFPFERFTVQAGFVVFKKGQKTLMSRCIAAGIVFFVVAIVQLLFGIIGADDDSGTMWNCINTFVNGVD